MTTTDELEHLAPEYVAHSERSVPAVLVVVRSADELRRAPIVVTARITRGDRDLPGQTFAGAVVGATWRTQAGPSGAASTSPPRADSIGLLSLRRQRDDSPDLDGRAGVGRRDQPCRISVGKRVDHEVALLYAVDDLSHVELSQVP
jgi:hypothetical protein